MPFPLTSTRDNDGQYLWTVAVPLDVWEKVEEAFRWQGYSPDDNYRHDFATPQSREIREVLELLRDKYGVTYERHRG